jgi:3-oxoacyl-[acyl-carrier protein] reductase
MGGERSFFVTGSASGIGKYLTEQLIVQGHCVFATDVNMDALRDLAERGAWPTDRVRLESLDVRDPDAWNRVFAAAVAAFGKVDVCMNVAGVLMSSWMQDSSVNEIHSQVDINVKGVMFGATTAARHMIQRNEGHIINVASMAGVGPVPGLSVYSGTKYAVRAFSIAAAQELRAHNVYVTVFCPDSVNTPLLNLPKDNDAAAMIWSGFGLLSVEQVGQVILTKVLTKKPLVCAIPWSRQMLARMGDQFPALCMSLVPLLQARGRKQRLKLRGPDSP